jgi:predicted ribosomally synthesized peptide with nif11-like leader
MSQAKLKEFLPMVLTDAKLADQLKNTTDKGKFSETLTRLGKERGYEFTADDVDAVLIKNKKNPLDELSPEQKKKIEVNLRPPATSDGCGAAWTTLFGWCNS